jgi:hypothetical protein
MNGKIFFYRNLHSLVTEEREEFQHFCKEFSDIYRER